jgi:RNA polymerase sigma-70 factor (ECF subfamily)
LRGYLERIVKFYFAYNPMLRALRARDADEQIAFWETMRNRAYTFLLKHWVDQVRAREQANDAAQEMLEQFVNGRARYTYDVDFTPWSYTVLHRHLKKRYERRHDVLDHNQTLFLDSQKVNYGDGIRDPDSSILPDRMETGQLLHRALQTVSASQRRALLMFYGQGRPAKEIADLLGCSEAVVNSDCYRGRKAMRRYFANHGLTLEDLLPRDRCHGMIDDIRWLSA